MTDSELIEAFESTSLPAGQFSHVEHVRAAWWYLREGSLPHALARFTEGLRRFATAHGAVGKYHETITVAYMLIIAERLDSAADLTWEQFAARNPDLLSHAPSILATYYTEAALTSERARRVFVMPDRCRPNAQLP